MKRVLIIFFVVGVFLQAKSQEFPSQLWHDGKIVLLEGDTLRGQIRYSQETEIVEFMSKGMNTAIAFTGRKLLYFEIFDGTVNQYREFFALPYALSGNYETPVLFEVIHEGQPFSLLSRERVEYRVVNSPYAVGASYSRLELMYTYYFLNGKGRIIRYNGSKKELPYIFKNRAAQIKKYVKSNRIRSDNRADLLKVLMYYNTLFNKESNG